jgi:WhiB family redox-sensing transcriptional regulator
MSLTDLFGADTAAWSEGAKCANAANPDAWFPVSEARALPVAKALCAGCPVVNDCLAYALERPELEGIWGGTTDAQRARLRGDTSALPTRIQCGTQAGVSAHKRRGEPKCRPCRDAAAAYKRQWAESRGGAA